MGYRNYGYGSYLPVRIHNNNVEIRFNTGVEYYPTRSKLETDWQINKFDLLETLFVIEHDGVRYVGHYDGSISGYDRTTNILTYVSGYQVPKKPHLKQVGGVQTVIACAAQLDIVRERIVYMPYTFDEFVFNEPFREDVFMPTALAESLGSAMNKLYVVNNNGEEIDCNEKGQWIVQAPFPRVCNSSIF